MQIEKDFMSPPWVRETRGVGCGKKSVAVKSKAFRTAFKLVEMGSLVHRQRLASFRKHLAKFCLAYTVEVARGGVSLFLGSCVVNPSGQEFRAKLNEAQVSEDGMRDWVRQTDGRPRYRTVFIPLCGRKTL